MLGDRCAPQPLCPARPPLAWGSQGEGIPQLPGDPRGGFRASSVPHLPEDEVEQQRVVDAVLGVENLPGGRPAEHHRHHPHRRTSGLMKSPLYPCGTLAPACPCSPAPPCGCKFSRARCGRCRSPHCCSGAAGSGPAAPRMGAPARWRLQRDRKPCHIPGGDRQQPLSTRGN